MPTRKSNSKSTPSVIDAKVVSPSNTGRIHRTDYEIRKIELSEQINYQEIRGLEARLNKSATDADIEEINADISKTKLGTAQINLDIATIEGEIASIEKETKELDKGTAEVEHYLAGRKQELTWFKGLELLKGVSLEIDQLEADYTHERRVFEAEGGQVTQRQFFGKSLNQIVGSKDVKAFLKGE